ncbi:TPA: Eag protein [Escherichia coli]|nr:Eag protein [Escherichia coli]HDC8710240.1 Eag protein [Escherichia coli]HDD0158706.1 Eag protein [Escherichia coli]HDX6589317.1 Eag protein [Escherichia coli]
MSCPKCGSGNIAKEKTMRGWSDDYVCCDCGYNDSKDAFGERGKNEFVKINKEREGN